MVFFFSTRTTSADFGERLVRVECDECGCEYFYELRRMGTGSSSSPYGIGASSDARASQDQSHRDVQERLAFEADLVPCPECNWINDELVAGYRRSRYRQLGMAAAGIAFFGTVASLFGAWFTTIGPQPDRGALPYYLVGGPALFVSLGVMVILLRTWLRSRIRPNKTFPLEPQLPPGSPPAMLLSDSGEELQPAEPQDHSIGVGKDWVDLQIGKHELPPVCSVCGGVSLPEHAYKIPVSDDVQLDVPRCAECRRRLDADARRLRAIASVCVLLGWGVACLSLSFDAIGSAMLLFPFAIAWVVIDDIVKTAKTAPAKVVDIDMSRGTVRLRFRNSEYCSSMTQTDAKEN